jgi:hypothetical protein
MRPQSSAELLESYPICPTKMYLICPVYTLKDYSKSHRVEIALRSTIKVHFEETLEGGSAKRRGYGKGIWDGG